MAGVGTFRSGKGGRVVVGATNCRLNKWSVTESGTKLDTTNFESYTAAYGFTDAAGAVGRTFKQGLIGEEGATFNIGGNWDPTQNPSTDPPGLYVREDGPRIKLYPSRIDGMLYDFLSTILHQVTVNCSPPALVTFDVNGESQGPYTRLGQVV
jgi:hypothetical protein